MGNIGWSGIIIVAVLVVLLFGRGKISSIMGDVAKGIKSFKRGMSSDNPDQTSSIPSPSEETSSEETSSEETSSEKTSSEKTTNEDQNSEKK